jgi:hypothetical protein
VLQYATQSLVELSENEPDGQMLTQTLVELMAKRAGTIGHWETHDRVDGSA